MSIRNLAAQPLNATARSTTYATIQMRRGQESQMDKSKFLPAEFGATTDTKKLFFAFAAGDVQQLVTYQNMEGLMAKALAEIEEEYLGAITTATQNALSATSQAASAASAANSAAEEANEIINEFRNAVDGTLINDTTPSDSMVYSSKKVEDTFLKETEAENDYLKKSGDGSNVTVTFMEAAERAGVQSGDTLAVAFSKLAKFCTDMQDYVFSAPIDNLLSTDSTRPLAASMGKQINDDLSATKDSLPFIQYASTDGSSFSKNFTNISPNANAEQNKSAFFVKIEGAAGWSNAPEEIGSSAWVGYREVFMPNTTHYLVKITEVYPVPGRIWTNYYNSSAWSRWVSTEPNDKLKKAVYDDSGENFGKNFLQITLTDKKGKYNEASYFSVTSDNRNDWKNIPPSMPSSGTVIGYREVFYRRNIHVMVKITEMYPVQGRQYFRFYNSDAWNVEGWKTITPS